MIYMVKPKLAIIISSLLVVSFVVFFINLLYDNPQPKDGTINYFLKDIKSNDHNWKLIFTTHKDNLGKTYEVDDINKLYNAKDNFYVIEENKAYYTTADNLLELYHNDKIVDRICNDDIDKICFGSLKDELDPESV